MAGTIFNVTTDEATRSQMKIEISTGIAVRRTTTFILMTAEVDAFLEAVFRVRRAMLPPFAQRSEPTKPN